LVPSTDATLLVFAKKFGEHYEQAESHRALADEEELYVAMLLALREGRSLAAATGEREHWLEVLRERLEGYENGRLPMFADGQADYFRQFMRD